MIDEKLTDERTADVMVKVLEEPDEWQTMMPSLLSSTAKATEDTFGPMLKTITKMYGQDSPQAEMVRAARERSLRSVSEGLARPFILVAGHPELSEDGATRFHVFLTVLARDMILKRGAEAAIKDAIDALMARFPEATSREKTVSLEIMSS